MNLRIILEKNVLLYAKAKANKHIKKENKIKKEPLVFISTGPVPSQH